METTPGGWTVIDRDAAVLTRTYSFTKGASSNTFVARMQDGSLMVVSPSTDLTQAAAAELLGFGDVGAIVANNGMHHMGQAIWRERFPEARCFASPEAAARIQSKNPAAGAFEPLAALESLCGPCVGFREVPKTKAGEMWCWAQINGGHAWYVSDVLVNLESLPASLLPRLLFWASGSAPGFRVFHLSMRFMVSDRKGALRLLMADMEERPPTVVVPAHGGLVTHDEVATETRRIIEAAL